MKRVRYISGYTVSEKKGHLTKGKVYDVITTSEDEDRLITIQNDLGYNDWYFTRGCITGKPIFEDVTSEYRSGIIMEILN